MGPVQAILPTFMKGRSLQGAVLQVKQSRTAVFGSLVSMCSACGVCALLWHCLGSLNLPKNLSSKQEDLPLWHSQCPTPCAAHGRGAASRSRCWKTDHDQQRHRQALPVIQTILTVQWTWTCWPWQHQTAAASGIPTFAESSAEDGSCSLPLFLSLSLSDHIPAAREARQSIPSAQISS